MYFPTTRVDLGQCLSICWSLEFGLGSIQDCLGPVYYVVVHVQLSVIPVVSATNVRHEEAEPHQHSCNDQANSEQLQHKYHVKAKQGQWGQLCYLLTSSPVYRCHKALCHENNSGVLTRYLFWPETSRWCLKSHDLNCFELGSWNSTSYWLAVHIIDVQSLIMYRFVSTGMWGKSVTKKGHVACVGP